MTATLIHPEWQHIVRDLTLCEESLPRLTRVCLSKKTKEAAMEVCEMCRSLFGAFIDADHFIQIGIDLDQIILNFGAARNAVAATAKVLNGSDRQDVDGYSENILMRKKILTAFRSGGEFAALETMEEFDQDMIGAKNEG